MNWEWGRDRESYVLALKGVKSGGETERGIELWRWVRESGEKVRDGSVMGSLGFYIYFLIFIIKWSGGRVSTRQKTQNPWPARNPNKKNNKIQYPSMYNSRAGGQVGIHSFLPTPRHLYLNRLPISASQISFFFDGALYTDLLYSDYYK